MTVAAADPRASRCGHVRFGIICGKVYVNAPVAPSDAIADMVIQQSLAPLSAAQCNSVGLAIDFGTALV